MITEGDEPLLVVANRLLEIVARQLHKAFKGRVELAELRSLGAPAVQDVLRRWDGRGRFEPFATERIRWSILREVRRQAMRDRRASFRHDVSGLSAGEDVANALPDDPLPVEAKDGEPGGPTLGALLRKAATVYTVELSVCDPDEVPDAAHDVELDARRMQTRLAAERLPEPFASLVHRYYYRGETVEEMAEGLGMSRSTIFDRLNRAVEKLREELCPDESARVVPFGPA
jgi:RNA polymerase sigma factor (sigma-70 family)